MRENFLVIGHHLDIAEDASTELLTNLFADVTIDFLADYERVYNLKSTGTDAVRRNRIISAMRARGGLSKAYFESIGNKLGEGTYTVVLTEGSAYFPFIVAPTGPDDTPKGPATLIPDEVTSGAGSGTCYEITVTVNGSASEPELEKLFARLKPAWTSFVYVYVP